jgi:RNA polymerase subunit RPABC4/transcription elongation factor Spt4
MQFSGTYPLQFTNVWNGTKVLFDDNISEIAAFKKRLEVHIKCLGTLTFVIIF